ncbi:MAG: DUF4358 domain-containing protein [Acetatifactor sp.]
MKIIKKVFPLILISVLMLTGCSGQTDESRIDTNAMVRELLEKVEFEDELNRVEDAGTIKMLYDVDNATEAYVYISSGATAEEIAVFTFENKEAAELGLKKAEERLTVQKENYTSYVPEEVKKLDNAVVKQTGNYVVLCVSEGDEAGKIIEGYMKH